jgi:alkanesulfonate monooxygenase SsuD/methylene tetrahydromethanopterin reductase-like flavin-dependent oxidoreductase (luciferase family)
MTARDVILGMTLTDGYGNLHGAWRAPGVDPGSYADIDASIRAARAAERGLFTFLFTPDFPAVRGDVEHTTISNVLDPIVSLTAIARATERIGFVATGSTTFQEPFNLARSSKRSTSSVTGEPDGTR